MRVASRKKSGDDKEASPPKPKEEEKLDQETIDEEEETIVKSPPKAAVIISGVVGKVEKDFPTEAVKHTHEKPQATHDARIGASKPVVIHQPRK